MLPAAASRARRLQLIVAAAAAVFLVLLALVRLMSHAGPDELGVARDQAVHARLEMAAQERRLAAMMLRGTGASAAGCPGPPFVPAELAPAPGGASTPLVLVTGGAGFIGSALVADLLALRYRVRVLDNLSSGNSSNLPLEHAALELVVGDVTDAEACASAVAGVDTVFHLAAFSRVLPSLGGAEAAAACQRANVEGTLNVLEAARAAKVRRLIYAGSSTAYGGDEEADDGDESAAMGAALAAQAHGAMPRPPLLPSWELDRPAPRTPYAVSKHQGELLCAMYDATFGLHTASLRLFMVYGPREPRSGTHATVVGKFVAAAAAGKPMQLEGDGQQTRDFVFVSDVSRAFVLAMQAEALPRRALINVGSGVATRVEAVADALAPGPHAQAPRRRQDMRHTMALTCAAQRLLGWAPRVPLADGLADMLRMERER
jgi:nucleoside-diphosphate-sugar epimerase